jgi:hypothetical protein
MSIRDYLNQNLRRATLYCWAASIAGIVVVLTQSRDQHVFRVALVVCVILFVFAYYHMFIPRCPRCRTRLLYALASFGIHLRLPRWYRSCPSCGLSFDTQRDSTPRPNHAMERTADRRTLHF